MIEVKNAFKELGEFSLRGVDLRVETGEYFVVLGPTGAGKTVLLECIAGLYWLDGGEVWLDGREVTDLDPEFRNVGYVPQDYVLFPHMSLRSNIEFSLTLTDAPRPDVDARVLELANALGIEHLLERSPRTLSGGEQQRGALARALAPSPAVLLLDEPLSALDEGTRAELSSLLTRISQDLGTTVIHVCHNFEEALDLADRCAVMREGLILQVGPPAHVFRKPANGFLARFVGAYNLLPVIDQDREAGAVVLEQGVDLIASHIPDDLVLLAAIRPEEISVHPDGDQPAGDDLNILPCAVTKIEDRGRVVRLHLEDRVALMATLTRQAFLATGVHEGQRVLASFHKDSVHLLTS